MERIETGQGREQDLDSCWTRATTSTRTDVAAAADHHLRARAVHPVVDRSAIEMFRDDYCVHIKEGGRPYE